MNDSTKGGIKYQTISQEEFNEKLKNHLEWVKLPEPQRNKIPQAQVRLNLSQFDLTNLDLTNLDLSEAVFQNSRFSGLDLKNTKFKGALLQLSNFDDSDLSHTDFSGATLDGASLKGATLINSSFVNARLHPHSDGKIRYQVNLSKADLTGADLTDSQFEDAVLIETIFHDATLHNTVFPSSKTAGAQFGGADTTGVKFPSEDYFEGRLKTIEEASRISRKLFAWLFGFMGLSILTIFSTKDIQLITNSKTFPLPVIQTPIPLNWFYLIIPIILLAIYLYFHLNQIHIWKLISRLPAFFPDGTPLDEKIFPWMLNTWSRNYFSKLKENSNQYPLRRIQFCLVVFLFWWSAPFVLIGLWWRYIPRHDPWSGLEITIIFFSFILSSFFFQKTKAILKRRANNHLSWRSGLVSKTFLSGIFVLIITCFISYQSIWGNLFIFPPTIRYYLAADLSRQEVSVRPNTWDLELEEHIYTPEDSDKLKTLNKQLKFVKGIQLQGANLRFLNAEDAFLAKADLSGADLYGANLESAFLPEAYLPEANLKNTNLTLTNFYNSNLSTANLENAHISGATFYEAFLTEANLKGAYSWKANFQGAYLSDSNLQSTIFWKSKFNKATVKNVDLKYAIIFANSGLNANHLKTAKNVEKALYDIDFRNDLGIPNHNLKQLIQKVVEIHYPNEIYSKKKQLEELDFWYCEYSFPECKNPRTNIPPLK